MRFPLKLRFLIGLGIILGAVASGVGFFSKHYVVPILMYHHVEESSSPKSDTVSPENFARQMDFIKENGYHVLSMDQFLNAKKIFHKEVVITFDDGNKDNFTKAYPVLKQHGFLAIIFIIPETVGKDGFLSWEDIKEMEKNGISFGSHTWSHIYLPDVSEQEQRKQIFLSKQAIEEKLGHPIQYFCYPSGGFSGPIKALVKEAGYEAAVTTNRGSVRFNRDLYELKRIKMTDNTKSDLALWAKLSGYYNLFRVGKKSCGGHPKSYSGMPKE